MKRVSILFICLWVARFTFGQTVVIVDGLQYSLSGIYASFSGVTAENTSKSITIPSTISYQGLEYEVTSIRSSAFFGNKTVERIVVPNSIISIGEYNQEIKGKTNVEIIPVSA